jgi:NADPH:quinone reductase-like Zn-dependent oxidoreductase
VIVLRSLVEVDENVANDVCAEIGVRYVYFVLRTDSDVLAKVADLIDRGEIKPLPVVEFPVSRAVEAWEFAAQRNRKGKVVINFVSEEEA